MCLLDTIEKFLNDLNDVISIHESGTRNKIKNIKNQ